MKLTTQPFFIVLLASFLLLSNSALAQENNDYEQEKDTTANLTYIAGRGFHLGLYVGGYWGNRNTAYIYDGYGFDINGQRNTFGNSILYNQIVNVYGGGNGGADLIAQLLNVNPGDWYFSESDMPFNLRYTTTYLVGLNMRYRIDKKSSIMLNINGSKLVVNGKFTISTNGSTTGTTNGVQNQSKINQFTITGAEQRLLFQLGYQRILGKNEKFNFLIEGGMNFILAKMQKNQAFLYSDKNGGANNFSIDLMSIYSQSPYNFYSAKYLTGASIGVFGGFGFNVNINPKYSIQLLYSPSYDRIPLGYSPNFKMQHGAGLRIYYNMGT